MGPDPGKNDDRDQSWTGIHELCIYGQVQYSITLDQYMN